MTGAHYKCLVAQWGQTVAAKKRLEACDTIIGAVIDWARPSKQELLMVKMVVNIDTNGGSLNVPEVEASELAATIAELETTLRTEGGKGAALETRGAWLSAQSVETKVIKECWSAWATMTVILFGSEFDAPDEAVVTTTESPDDGGVDLEKIGNKPANKLLDVDHKVDHWKLGKNHKQMGQPTSTTWQHNVAIKTVKNSKLNKTPYKLWEKKRKLSKTPRTLGNVKPQAHVNVHT